ncbi:TolC family protein [Brevundimonas staleyi]|uniref:TolC family protein n=1 Tax=Brevundimonas staleyi TaxID=74326 RepID=A0ABW0FN48_9CAUL
MIDKVRGIFLKAAGLAAILAVPVLARAETLEAAVQRGLLRHPDVRMAQAEVSQATIEVEMARNAWLPTVSASTGPAAAGLGYDLTVTQALYDWGQSGSVVDQRRALLAQQEANLEVVRDDVALQIVEAHFDVVDARTQLSLLADHVERLNELMRMTQARVEDRYADQSEAGRVNLAVATAQGVQARLEGDLADAMDRYALLVGTPATELRLPSEAPAFLETVKEEGALDTAIASSPLYRKALLSVQVADAAIREANAARLPRLNLEGGVQRREIGGRLVNDSSIGLRFRLSTQQGVSALQRPRLEAERREQARWAAEGEARDLQRTVGGLARSDAALAARIGALSDQSAQADEVRTFYGEQFLAGRREIQDLVIMETEQFEAERQRVELVIERLRLQYRAAAQLGRLTPMMVGDQMQAPGVQP